MGLMKKENFEAEYARILEDLGLDLELNPETKTKDNIEKTEKEKSEKTMENE